jgi:hypothetical protein
MKIYLALHKGAEVGMLPPYAEPGEVPSTVLMSYHYMKKDMKYAQFLNKHFELFVDSGAFTVHQLGAEIDIKAYIAFIKKVNPPLVAGLDVIGNAEATAVNVQKMRDAGIEHVIPTFHRGSDPKHLHDMLKWAKYIALGGMAGIGTSTPDIIAWLDRIWRIIAETDKSIKVHGFACTGDEIMRRYPWTSVDSSSWAAPVRWGRFDHPTQGVIHPDDMLAQRYGNEKDNPELWHPDSYYKRRMLIIKESAKQVKELQDDITAQNANYDWNWLTAQHELPLF